MTDVGGLRYICNFLVKELYVYMLYPDKKWSQCLFLPHMPIILETKVTVFFPSCAQNVPNLNSHKKNLII